MRPADTSPQAWEVYLGLVRAMSPAERLRRALELSEEVRCVAEAGLRLKPGDPDALQAGAIDRVVEHHDALEHRARAGAPDRARRGTRHR